MTGRVLRAVAVPGLLVWTACALQPARVSTPRDFPRARVPTLRVQVTEAGRTMVREVPLEDYAAAAALSELHPEVADADIAERIFEIQTIVARTYAAANRGRHGKDGFDLCSTTHCQLYEPARLTSSRWAAMARAAARHTAGQVLWFGGGPASAVFHADCGGHTSNASAVWGGNAPAYLAGQPDDGPAGGAHREWTFDSSIEALRATLNMDARTAVGARLEAIEVAGRDAAGRAEQIVLRGTRTFVVRGEVFRDVVTRQLGPGTIRSTLFSVKAVRGAVTFSGKGFGHGVGLCQAGARARVSAGASPRDVLGFYFPGTTLHP